MSRLEALEFRRIRNVPEILNVTFDFIRLNFGVFWRSLLFLAFPPLVAGLTIFSYFMVAAFDSLSMGTYVEELLLPFLWVSIAAMLLSSVGITILVAAVHVIVRLYIEKGPGAFGVRDVREEVRRIFWMLLLTILGLEISYLIISLLAVFVPFGQFGIVIGLAFATLYFPVRIYERRGFIQSIVVSSKLVEGRWWATVGMFWLFMFLNVGLVGAFTLPLILFSWLVETHMIDFGEPGQGGSLVRIVGAVLLAVYMTALFLMYAIPFLSLIFHYYSQRERKNSIGLLEEIETIGAEA